MAVEARRGCGYRKIGGLYLVSGGQGMPCDRLPIPLKVCPTCHHGIKQTRGWTWIDLPALVGGVHQQCQDEFPCPLCMAPEELGRSGLLWIGAEFYKTPRDFDREAAALGISRRIATIPRGFKTGETWILFAHPNAVEHADRCECGHTPAEHSLFASAAKCTVFRPALTPGIFKVWRPERIEKILPESWRIDPSHFEELQDLADKGITPVFVPDDDPDHQPRKGQAVDEEHDETPETIRAISPTAGE